MTTIHYDITLRLDYFSLPVNISTDITDEEVLKVKYPKNKGYTIHKTTKITTTTIEII